MLHTSLKDEQQQADPIGLAQTASRMAALLYDIDAGRRVELRLGQNRFLTEQAIGFLRGAEKASTRLDDVENNLVYLLGSETAGVSYYRYYIEAKKRMGYDIPSSDGQLKKYVATLNELYKRSAKRNGRRNPNQTDNDVRKLADFFLGLSSSMLGLSFPVAEAEY